MTTLKDISLITCSYNTPQVTETMLKSFKFHHEDLDSMNVVIIENSTNDETKKILDANSITYIMNPGGTHSRSMDIAFEKCKSEYALIVDTDIIFLSNIIHFFSTIRQNKTDLAGIECGSRGGYNLMMRVHPWFMFINIDSIKKHHIKFHDNERIIKTSSIGFYNNIPINTIKTATPMYDVGSTFYEDVKNAGLKIENLPVIQNLFYHAEGISWHKNSGSPGLERFTDHVWSHYKKYIERFKDVSIKGFFTGSEASNCCYHDTATLTPELAAIAKQDQDRIDSTRLIFQIAQQIEKNNLIEALSIYNKNRQKFDTPSTELIQADSIMEKVRIMLKK